MQTSSYSASKIKQNFEKLLDKKLIKKTAKQTGFHARKSKKIGSFEFVVGLIICFSLKKNTFRQWAQQIEALSKRSVTKQALFKRINAKTVVFCKELLQEAVAKKADTLKGNLIFKNFGKVILQDSTTLKLADCLSKVFPGNCSRGIQKAVARIQAIVDLKTMQFLSFSLSGFTRNDQAASADIIPLSNKGDLVIRDLGYFALATFEKMMDNGVHLLSRLRFGVKIYALDGTEIKLISLLKAGKEVDRQVLIGEKKVPVRLVMLPVPKQVAAEKKRKAKQDRDKRLNHSKEYYSWLEFSVCVTTVGEDIWTTEDVLKAYRVRWQIEIVFKSWKTGGLQMQQLIDDKCTNENRIKTCIYLMLLFITLFCKKLYLPVLNTMRKSVENRLVSLIKMLTWVCENIIDVLIMSKAKFNKMILEKCCYEKRNTRENMALTILKCKN